MVYGLFLFWKIIHRICHMFCWHFLGYEPVSLLLILQKLTLNLSENKMGHQPFVKLSYYHILWVLALGELSLTFPHHPVTAALYTKNMITAKFWKSKKKSQKTKDQKWLTLICQDIPHFHMEASGWDEHTARFSRTIWKTFRLHPNVLAWEKFSASLSSMRYAIAPIGHFFYQRRQYTHWLIWGPYTSTNMLPCTFLQE